MKQCKCGSYAVNDHLHGRERGVDLDLCDVCYWRKRAEAAEIALRMIAGRLPPRFVDDSHNAGWDYADGPVSVARNALDGKVLY